MEGSLRKRIPVTRSGWITFRAISNEHHHPVDDVYVVAETSPIYVYCGQQQIRSKEDAEYFVRWIDGITRLAQAHPGWRNAVLARFGAWLLLGLEFALAADIVGSVIAPTWNDIGQLASIALIRTFLNYFLEKDIDEARRVAVEPNEKPAR